MAIINSHDTIRILYFSDWRIQPLEMADRMIRSVGPVDLILYGGDDIVRFEKTGLNWFHYWASQCEFGVGAVLGNDCLQCHSKVLSGDKVWNLHEVGMIAGHLGIVGIEGSVSHKVGRRRTINDIGYIIHPDSQTKKHLDTHVSKLGVLANNLVIVSHTPPANVLDLGMRFGLDHLGSPILRTYIEMNSPRLVLCGHCHSHGGQVETVGDTVVVNAASDDRTAMSARMALIEVPDKGHPEVTWINPQRHTVMSLPRIGPQKASALAENGIHCPDDLFGLPDDRLRDLQVGLGPKTITRLRTKQKAVSTGRPVRNGLTDTTLDVPKSLVIYDVETNLGIVHPHEPWLVGAIGPDGQVFQRVVLDKNIKQRKQMYHDFLEFLGHYPDSTLCSWSGTRFDQRAILAGLTSWNKPLVPIWAMLEKYDPLPSLRKTFELPFDMSWSLKSIARWLGFTGYEAEEQPLDGFQVGLMYELYYHHYEPVPLEKVCSYNLVDLRALEHVMRMVREFQERDNDLYDTFYPAPMISDRSHKPQQRPMTKTGEGDRSSRSNRGISAAWLAQEASRLGIGLNRARQLGQNRLKTLTTHEEALAALHELRVEKYIAITGKRPQWADD